MLLHVKIIDANGILFREGLKLLRVEQDLAALKGALEAFRVDPATVEAVVVLHVLAHSNALLHRLMPQYA